NSAGANELNPPGNTITDPQVSSHTTQSVPEIRKAIPVARIPKAIPVQPQDSNPAEIRRAIPVKPLDQENQQNTLLRSAVQPPDNVPN
ncbi:MAG: hypothetical protein ACM3KL_00555, partial [Alphaproteobacteria bacterium]